MNRVRMLEIFWREIIGHHELYTNFGWMKCKLNTLIVLSILTAGTIFECSGPHFCKKSGPNSRTVGRTNTATSPSCFSSNITKGWSTFAKIFKWVQISERDLTIVRTFFSTILLNLPGLDKTTAAAAYVDFGTCTWIMGLGTLTSGLGLQRLRLKKL